MASINKQKLKNIEIFFIDSASTDKTCEIIEKNIKKYQKFFSIKIKKITKNIGFAEGNNLGAKESTGKYLFFLGPDTKLGSKTLINFISKAKKTKNKDYILIPRQKNYTSEKFLFDGICTDIFQFPYKLYDSTKPDASKKPFYCDGAAIFLPKTTFLLLGGFDSELFMFCDDIDLSWKAHLLKVPLINVSNAEVFHFSGGSLKGGIIKNNKYATTYLRRYLGERNTVRNFLKNYSFWVLLWLLPVYFSINLFEIFLFTAFGKFRVSYQYLAAIWWNVYHFKSTYQKRKWIQKRRLVNDMDILKKLYFGSGKFNSFIQIKIPTFE